MKLQRSWDGQRNRYDVYDKFETWRGTVDKTDHHGWKATNDQGTLVAQYLDTKEAAASFLVED